MGSPARLWKRPQAAPPPLRGGPAFTLVELLLALALGLGLGGVMLQALLVEGRGSAALVRVWRERGVQRRALELVRGDLQRSERLELATGVGAACGLGGRTPVLQLHTAQGPITYSVGAPPSEIWRGQVLMRCGPAFGLDGEPSSGAPLNRVLVDALPAGGFRAEAADGGLLRLEVRQEFAAGPPGGSGQRIASTLEVGMPQAVAMGP